MIVALSIWHDRIAPLFDASCTLSLYEFQGSEWWNRGVLRVPPRLPVAERVRQLVRHKVDELVCGAISRPALELAETAGLVVHALVAGEASAVLQGWLDGRLNNPEFALPGAAALCGRRARHHGRGPVWPHHN